MTKPIDMSDLPIKVSESMFWDTEPEKRDFVIAYKGEKPLEGIKLLEEVNGVRFWYRHDLYSEQLEGYYKRQVYPQPEWVDGKQKRPEYGKPIYWRKKGFTAWEKRSELSTWFMNNMFEKEWCYCEDQDRRVDYYERHRIRWKHCDPCIDGATGYIDALNNLHLVVVFDESIFSATIFRMTGEETSVQEAHISSSSRIEVELLELFCSTHGLELIPVKNDK